MDARAAWPGVQVDDDEFLAYAGERVEGERLDHLGDLYLEKEHDVQVYEELFDVLIGQCLTAEQSTKLIAGVLKDN